jgi:hypothetical protein
MLRSATAPRATLQKRVCALQNRIPGNWTSALKEAEREKYALIYLPPNAVREKKPRLFKG